MQTAYNPCIQSFQACTDCLVCKLKVEGIGSIKVQPDTADIILGVITDNTQLKPAQEQNAAVANQIISTIDALGISSDNIKTQSYTIDPQYDYIDGKKVFRGYNVTHTLKITVYDIGKVGEIIDRSVASGANTVMGISFIVSAPSKYYRQALTSAIDDALAKAMSIGRRLGVNVSQIPVRIVEEDYQNVHLPQPFLMQASGSSTPVQTGQVEITARIEAVFLYTPVKS
jgi:hypothetical protein